MLDDLRFLARRYGLGVADFLVTLPFVRWSWTSLADEEFRPGLSEFRPADPESAREMARGRFLLASKLVDSGGRSPFALDVAHEDWRNSLNSFSWLRHFRSTRERALQNVARTLVLDWIVHSGSFEYKAWAPALTAQRVMNWLRHYDLLLEGASLDQKRAIARSLGAQIKTLKIRGRLATEPVDQLLAAIALLAAALCSSKLEEQVQARFDAVERQLETQFDRDGLHLSRNVRVQLQLLIELITLRQALDHRHKDFAARLGTRLEKFHFALGALTLSTGQPALFNGASPVPHNLLIAVQLQGPAQGRAQGTLSGYGVAAFGDTVVIADSGVVPEAPFSAGAHAGALGFEMSHRTELVFCNCGPANGMPAEERLLFRQGLAHSAPTINGFSAANLPEHGPFAGRLRQVGRTNELAVDPSENSLFMRCRGFERRFGTTLERRITLLSGGRTVVGQDRMVASGRSGPSGTIACRFHLGPGVTARQREDEQILVLTLPSGAAWTFLWEGASMRLEDSLRQSALFGFQRTRQIVLEAPVRDGAEIAWIVTLDGA